MLLCRLSYRPASGPAGTRTRNPPINNRSNPLLHIAVPVRTVGIEPTTPGWKPGVFPLHHVHEAGENKAAQEAARTGRRGKSKYPAPTHHPRRNSQESNLLPPGLQPGAHPHEPEFHCLLHGITVQLSKSSSRRPVSGHAAARWEGLEPSSPGLEPGVLAVERPPLTGAHRVRHPDGLPEKSDRLLGQTSWSHSIRTRQRRQLFAAELVFPDIAHNE